LVLLLLVAGLALGYMVYAAFPGNALYFMTVSEFMGRAEAQDGRIVRVSGKLVDGSFHREGTSILSRFQLVDQDPGESSVNLNASYVGVLPDLFFNPHSEIILQGSYGPGHVFEADTILVKCPSKYRSLEDQLQQES
jgi:cytochrome c-type biogenesis protein CcmE